MNTHDLIVQRPLTPQQLVLLFHRVGSNAPNWQPLCEARSFSIPVSATALAVTSAW